MAGTVTAAQFLAQQRGPANKQTLPEDVPVDGVFNTGGLRSSIESASNVDFGVAPTPPVPDVLQNERSVFGAVLEALATAADPERAQRRAKEQREVAATNAQIDMRNKETEAAAIRAKSDNLQRTNAALIQLAGMEQANAQVISDQFFKYGVNPNDLSPAADEAMRTKFGAEWDIVKAIGGAAAEAKSLEEEATRAGIALTVSQAGVNDAQERQIRVKTNLMDVYDRQKLAAEVEILEANAGVAGEEAQLKLAMLDEQLEGLRNTNSLFSITKRIQNAEALIRELDALNHGEKWELMRDQMLAEIERARAETAQLNKSNPNQIQARMEYAKSTLHPALETQIGALMDVSDPTDAAATYRVQEEAHEAIERLHTEVDPEGFAQQGDMTAAAAAQRWLDGVTSNLERTIQSKGFNVSLTKATRLDTAGERVGTFTPEARKAHSKRLITTSRDLNDLSDREIEEIAYTLREDMDVDIDAVTMWLGYVDLLNANPYLIEGNSAIQHLKFDRDMMAANGMSNDEISEYSRLINAEWDSMRKGRQHTRRMFNKLRNMGVPKEQVNGYIRRISLNPDRPLSIESIRELSDFLGGLSEITRPFGAPSGIQPTLAPTGVHSSIIPRDQRTGG